MTSPVTIGASRPARAIPQRRSTTNHVRLLVYLVGLVSLVAGFVLKLGYSYPSPAGAAQPTYTDIVKLYPLRHLERHLFPYLGVLHVPTGAAVTSGHFIEYPVLTGIFIWACGLLVHSSRAFFDVTAAGLAMAGVGTTWLLARMSGARALLWAASPVLILYAFQNWDLLAVFATVAAVAAHRSGRPVWASVLIGIGACLKLYPALLIAPLVLDTAFRSSKRRAGVAAAMFLAVVTMINAPIAALSPSGWASPFTFQAVRNIDISTGSIWWIVPDLHMNGRAVDHISLVLLGVLSLMVLIWGQQRANATGHWPFVGASAALVVAFVEVNKVDSAQYAIWIAPFFVLLAVRWRWFAMWAVVEVGLYAAFFATNALTSPGFEPTYVLVFATCRFLVQASLIPLFLTAPETDSATGGSTIHTLSVRIRWRLGMWCTRQRLTLVGIGVAGAAAVVASVALQHGPSTHTLIHRCTTTYAHNPAFLQRADELATGHYARVVPIVRGQADTRAVQWACGQYSTRFRLQNDGRVRY